MIKVLVVDGRHERRAATVDALCELPGIEVRATADDASSALGLIDSTAIDAIVATSDLPGAAIVTLIDCARRRGLTDIIVAVAERPLLRGLVECWRDLGARHVVHTTPELVERVSQLAVVETHDDRRRAELMQLELAAAFQPRPAVTTYAGTESNAVVVRPAQRAHVAEDLSLGAVLHAALTQFGGVVPPEVQLHLEVGLDVPQVRCVVADIDRIARLMVRGACDALPLGGKVWLCVEREGPRHVRVEVLESSGRPRSPGSDLHVIRAIANRHGGEVRVVDLGGATSVQLVLPATVQDQN